MNKILAAAAAAVLALAGCSASEAVDDGQAPLVPAPFFAGDT